MIINQMLLFDAHNEGIPGIRWTQLSNELIMQLYAWGF